MNDVNATSRTHFKQRNRKVLDATRLAPATESWPRDDIIASLSYPDGFVSIIIQNGMNQQKRLSGRESIAIAREKRPHPSSKRISVCRVAPPSRQVMTMSGTFQVIPVQHYDNARYPQRSDRHINADIDVDTSISRRLSALLLSVVPLIFLATCHPQPTLQPATVVQTPVIVQAPPRVVVVTPLAQCSPNAIRCRDNATLESCPSGTWVARSCNEYCQETRGHDYFSNGCNTAAADPCQCTEDYGMLDGIEVEMEKGDL